MDYILRITVLDLSHLSPLIKRVVCIVVETPRGEDIAFNRILFKPIEE